MLATSSGLVKKSRLTDFDSPRSGGIIAINLREDDEVISAGLVSADDDLLLVSKHAQAIRFRANDEALRPMGRATSGVIGMRFTDGDQLLGMYVVSEGADVLVATGGGYAKRTPADQYPVQGRGGRGVLTARIVEARGELVGALMVHPDDEVFAITSAGGVIRTTAAEIKQSGRQTMGVRLVNLADGPEPGGDRPECRVAGEREPGRADPDATENGPRPTWNADRGGAGSVTEAMTTPARRTPESRQTAE